VVWGFESYIVSFAQSPFLYSVLSGIGYFFFFLLFFGYYFFFEWLWDGQTPGKRYYGLRVKMTNGLPLTFWPAFIRNVVRLVDFLPLLYGFGTVVAISNSLSQRAGDFAAGTIVVREGKREQKVQALKINEAVEQFLKAATTVPGTEDRGVSREKEEDIGIEGQKVIDSELVALAKIIGREDFELARDFLARRETLPLAARNRLASSLAVRIAEKLKAERPLDNEAFLSEIVTRMARFYAN
jgi:uncharacterized RDD family membrane protein YckC